MGIFDLGGAPSDISGANLLDLGYSPWDAGHSKTSSIDLLSPQQGSTIKVTPASEFSRMRKRFRPSVMLLIGRRDAGKTLTMSNLAKWMQIQYAKRGLADTYKIASNYWLDIADIYDPQIIEHIMQFPSWARNLYLCLDEIQTAALSRRSMANVNVMLGAFLTMIRKRHIEVIFTTQFPQVLDISLLIQVDLFLECEHCPETNSVTLYIHDYWGQWTGKNYRKTWPPPRWEADFVMGLGNVNGMFGHYRTEEVIAPMYVSEHIREKIQHTETKEIKGWEVNVPMDEAQEELEQRQMEQSQARELMEREEMPADLEAVLVGMPQTCSVTAIMGDIERITNGEIRRKAVREAVAWLKNRGVDVQMENKIYVIHKSRNGQG